MQELHDDVAAGLVHCVGHEPVLLDVLFRGHGGAALRQRTRGVGPDTAGNDERGAAAHALGIERRHALEPLRVFFKTQVHRPHDRTVGQGDIADRNRRTEVWVGAHAMTSLSGL